MDEQRTQQTLDELADLFLTGLRPSGVASGAKLEGPAPLRLPPKPAATRPHGATPTKSAMTEDPAPPLRLHRTESQEPAATPVDSEPQPLTIEAVVLGNLPGFGAPWLTQYAHHLSRGAGPVGLIHAEEPTLDMELVGPPGGPMPLRPELGPKGTLAETVGQLAALTQPPVRKWLVHLADLDSPTAAQLSRSLPRWTVLSGADDTAIVAAYRLIKKLAEHNGNVAKPVSLMVMGCDESSARAAADKLAAAAGNFLRTSLELVGSRKQMMPVERHDLGALNVEQVRWPQVVAMFQDTQPLTAAPIQTPEPTLPTAKAAESKLWEKVLSETVERQTPATPASVEPTPVQPWPAQPAATAQPTATHAAAPNLTESSGPDLAAMLSSGDLPGGVALEARCPRQPAVSLVLDQTGRLHLLRRQEASAQLALTDLLEARAWVREHLELLALTQRQCRFDTKVEPELHLFASEGKAAATLAVRLQNALRVHLLQQVEVGGASTWICTALS